MHHYQLGSKRKPCLVILHGWGIDGGNYQELAKLLSDNFFVLVPDLPGFGKTPEPKQAFNVSDYAKEVQKWLKTEGVQEAYFIGHSFGGRVLIKLSQLSPDLVKGLILTGTPGIERFQWKRSLKRLLYGVAAKGLKMFSFVPAVKRLRTRFYRSRDLGKLDGVMKQTFLKVIKEPLLRSAQAIQKPTLLLWGNRDQMTPVGDAERMLQIIPGSYLKIFTRVGHRLPYEKPHEFAREVIQFFT
ncbi:MAG: alpha/beta hydrolase [bacterium]|nr:alpha/beta hydrolase [bacterium]